MSRLRRLFGRLRGGRTFEADLDEELRLHLEHRIAEGVAGGLDPADARTAALRAFGGVEQAKEAVRDERPRRWLLDLGRDLRHGARLLRRSPGFAAVVIAILALGIGANTAVFSVIHAVLLRPLPYAAPERIVTVGEIQRRERPLSFSHPTFVDYDRDSTSFEHLAARRGLPVTLTGQGPPSVLRASQVTHDYFEVFGAQPRLGRAFLPAEDRPGAEPVVILGDALWRARFGADPDVLGRTIVLADIPYTVVGVMPASFRCPYNAELWLGLGRGAGQPQWRARDNRVGLSAIGLLRPEAGLEAVRAELAGIAERLARAHPDSHTDITVEVRPLAAAHGERFRPGLTMLLGAVALVLVLACANLANLLLGRTSARAGEFAVRLALGSGRGRLLRQVLAESCLLAALGGLAGLALASWFRDVILALGPSGFEHYHRVEITGGVFSFCAGVTLLTGLACGLVPAWRVARGGDLQGALRAGGRSHTGGAGARRLRGGLVVAQLALALVLLAGAGLFLKSFRRAQGTDLGFTAHGVTALVLGLSEARFPAQGDARRAFVDQLLERTRALPGVEAASVASAPPLDARWQTTFELPERPEPPGQRPSAEMNVVDGRYFAALAIPLVEGRTFSSFDGAAGAPVVIVDERFARRHWPARSAVGQRLRLAGAEREVVGVVGTVRVHGYAAPDGLVQAYLPYAQRPDRVISLLVRSAIPAAVLRQQVASLVAALDPLQPVGWYALEEAVGRTVTSPRLYTVLLAAFAAIAVLLAAVGLFGVVSYAVTQQTREIGIRIALGAAPRQVLRQTVARSLRWIALGLGLGLTAALLVARHAAVLLFEVSPTDPAVLAAVSALLALTALLAAWLPARRAARIDPMLALRAE